MPKPECDHVIVSSDILVQIELLLLSNLDKVLLRSLIPNILIPNNDVRRRTPLVTYKAASLLAVRI